MDQFTTSSGCNYCTSISCTPTITPAGEFSSRRDRIQIEHAILGFGTAKDTLIKILTSRSDYQRLEIAKDYIRTGETLTDAIMGDTRGKFLGVLNALTKPLPLFYAEELHHAISNKDFSTIIEIIVSLPGCAIREISVLYRVMYGVSLQTDLSGYTWFSFKKLMLELTKGDREEQEEVNMDQVKLDAEDLIKSGVDSLLRVKKDRFIEILSKRSFQHLRATFVAYEAFRTEKDENFITIFNDIENLFSGNLKALILAIVRNVINQPAFFAEELELALEHFTMTTCGQKLIRIIRGRCEIDLWNIQKEYSTIYHRSLESRIKEKTEKSFQQTLVAIIKKDNS